MLHFFLFSGVSFFLIKKILNPHIIINQMNVVVEKFGFSWVRSVVGNSGF